MPGEFPSRDQLLRRLFYSVVDLCKFNIADGLLVDLNAFVNIHEVRGGIEAGAISGSLDNTGQRGGSGALAIGAGNQNTLQPALRISQRLGKSAHMRQIKLALAGEFMAKGQ